MTLRPCARCKIPGISNKVWRRLSADQKAEVRSKGQTKIEGRGLCHACYCWARRHGKLEDYPLRITKTQRIKVRWLEEADPTRPIRAEVRRLAPSFGMSVRALDQAVRRAGIKHHSQPRLPNGWTDADLLEEWEALADPVATLYHEAQRLGPQFDLNPTTLLSALERLGVQSLRRAS